MLSFEQITELIGLVAKHRLRGVTLEREGFRFEIAGYEPQPNYVAPAPEPLPQVGSQTVGTPPLGSPPSSASAPEPSPASGAHVLTSPIVGTFYAASSPDAEPFVRPGDRVKKGQVLCIVEAMKLMNEIECDVDGTVVEVYPRNAQPVEYGEPLFAIAEG